MPLPIGRSVFNKDNVNRETDDFGVYELGNSEEILYIGEDQVYTRLMSHFADGFDPIPGAGLCRVQYTGSQLRATQR